MNNNSEDHKDWSRPLLNVAYSELESQNKALRELVGEILRYQAWSDINKTHIKVFEEKLREIGGDCA